MRIAICGASGFVGTYMSRLLVANGYEVVRIGREHFTTSRLLKDSLEGVEVVINLCGESFLKKWDEAYKHQLYVSRIETTKKLIKAIELCESKPSTYIATSSVEIYKENLVQHENSKEYGTDYLALLIKEYEHATVKVKELGLRCITFRLGYVLGESSSFLQALTKPSKVGINFIIGDGKQPVPWVHIDDVTNALSFAIKNSKINGIYNVVSPEVVKMKTFMQALGKAMKKPAIFKLSNFFLKFYFKEGAENLLKGSLVSSTKIEKDGYIFWYDNLSSALEDIYKK